MCLWQLHKCGWRRNKCGWPDLVNRFDGATCAGIVLTNLETWLVRTCIWTHDHWFWRAHSNGRISAQQIRGMDHPWSPYNYQSILGTVHDQFNHSQGMMHNVCFLSIVFIIRSITLSYRSHLKVFGISQFSCANVDVKDQYIRSKLLTLAKLSAKSGMRSSLDLEPWILVRNWAHPAPFIPDSVRFRNVLSFVQTPLILFTSMAPTIDPSAHHFVSYESFMSADPLRHRQSHYINSKLKRYDVCGRRCICRNQTAKE